MTDQTREQIFAQIENDYNNYWKCGISTVREVWRRYNKVGQPDEHSTKDELITDILTYQYGNHRMDIWRSFF